MNLIATGLAWLGLVALALWLVCRLFPAAGGTPVEGEPDGGGDEPQLR